MAKAGHVIIEMHTWAFFSLFRTLLPFFSQFAGITIGAFGIDNCAQEMNITGVCKNTVKADYAFTVISGDHGQFPAPPASLTFVSMDLQLVAEYESIIKPRSRTCVDNPCLHNGTCHDVEPHGLYRTVCIHNITLVIVVALTKALFRQHCC